MLSEFSPIPDTPDGERCREWVDLDEPLWHNKTVFPLVLLGAAEVQRLKGVLSCAERSEASIVAIRDQAVVQKEMHMLEK